ncbi:hypothetical protein BTO30_11250 [Domibacillus antri]|uniref:Uncharacterized protein n=1 Tax=Domibacillus antri TaxID=1714264 RepID=A0A1Q8Q461_9BACI|nr:hypothetical protein BTO30_11250 [Domibacillus antri]
MKNISDPDKWGRDFDKVIWDKVGTALNMVEMDLNLDKTEMVSDQDSEDKMACFSPPFFLIPVLCRWMHIFITANGIIFCLCIRKSLSFRTNRKIKILYTDNLVNS